MTSLIGLLKDQSGVSAAEYALILAIIGGAIAVAAAGLGDAISGAINETSECIDDPSETACYGVSGSRQTNDPEARNRPTRGVVALLTRSSVTDAQLTGTSYPPPTVLVRRILFAKVSVLNCC